MSTQLALRKSCTPTFAHLSKPTVNENLTLLRNALAPQPFSAAATSPSPLPFYRSSSGAKVRYLLLAFRCRSGCCRLLGRPPDAMNAWPPHFQRRFGRVFEARGNREAAKAEHRMFTHTIYTPGLALGRQHTLEFVHRKGDLGLSRERLTSSSSLNFQY